MAGAIGTLGETEFVAIWQFSRRMLAGDSINLPGLSMPPWRKFVSLSSPDGVPGLISWKGVAGLTTRSIIFLFFPTDSILDPIEGHSLVSTFYMDYMDVVFKRGDLPSREIDDFFLSRNG